MKQKNNSNLGRNSVHAYKFCYSSEQHFSEQEMMTGNSDTKIHLLKYNEFFLKSLKTYI